MTVELADYDLRFVAQRMPKDIRDLLTHNARLLMVGGGFVRAVIAGEEPSDIDIFGHDKAFLEAVAQILVAKRKEQGEQSRIHATKNAITVITPNRIPVQFITRWTFKAPQELVASFDFTVCQAAFWRHGNQSNDPWCSSIGERFYSDLAAKRLHYTSPVRDEEAGGSMLRVIKYVKRGYSIQVTSLGGVIARLTNAMNKETGLAERAPEIVLAGLLREVDPLYVIDGFDVADEHEPVDGEKSDAS